MPLAFWHWFHPFQILMFWNIPCQSDSCLFVKLSNEQRGKMQERKPEGLSVPPDMAFVLVPAGRRQVLVEININKAAPHRNTSHPGYKSKTYSLLWRDTMKGFLETSWKLTFGFFDKMSSSWGSSFISGWHNWDYMEFVEKELDWDLKQSVAQPRLIREGDEVSK